MSSTSVYPDMIAARCALALGHFRDFYPAGMIYNPAFAEMLDDAGRLAELSFIDATMREPDYRSMNDLLGLWKLYLDELQTRVAREQTDTPVRTVILFTMGRIQSRLASTDTSPLTVAGALTGLLTAARRTEHYAQACIAGFNVTAGGAHTYRIEDIAEFRFAMLGLATSTDPHGETQRTLDAFRRPVAFVQARIQAVVDNLVVANAVGEHHLLAVELIRTSANLGRQYRTISAYVNTKMNFTSASLRS